MADGSHVTLKSMKRSNDYKYYKQFYSYSAGIDFSRQNLTSIDVIF